MRVLWLCNIMLPAYAKAKGLSFSAREGWLSGSFDRIQKAQKNKEESLSKELILGVAFPGEKGLSDIIEGVYFYTFEENLDTPEIYDSGLETQMKNIINDFRPDIVHIFGTEFPHALAMTKAFGKPERTLVGIQGLCSVIAEKYMADLPENVINTRTIRDRLKHDSIIEQQEKYIKRGEIETKIIKNTGHITGRTAFDKEETSKINSSAKYHHMNETMRSQFYDGRWKENECRSHSIFLSQGDYPLKGFHYVLKAMPKILEKYPDAHVYVAGNSIIGKIDRRSITVPDDTGTVITGSRYPLFMRISAYGQYLRQIISDYHLKKHVTVLGKLSADQMKEQYLKSSLFICPSSVENSPNSLAEAMLLGMPVIAAKTGGIPSMMDNNKEGILYEPGNIDELSEAVISIWDEPVIAGVFGDNARKRALMDHDADRNFDRLIKIYNEIYFQIKE
ncbi:MAG: glycosyltransferase family 4 protein [Butyrivibrio sp.]|nr:glycosyltransferase family 4 protein [Butyrivibrio sp.]